MVTIYRHEAVRVRLRVAPGRAVSAFLTVLAGDAELDVEAGGVLSGERGFPPWPARPLSEPLLPLPPLSLARASLNGARGEGAAICWYSGAAT